MSESTRRPPGTLAERFWSIARSAGPAGDETNPEPIAVVRHVLGILDALDAGEVGDEVSQATISFLALLRQSEQQGDMSYASPEQARGETIDERSLVFSVGVLLFEELTGRHPFGAVDSPRRFARIQKGEMGSGVQYFPQVPTELRTVLMRAMGPFPEERYSSMRELRAALEHFANPMNTSVAPLEDERTAPGARSTRHPGLEDAPTGVHARPDLPARVDETGPTAVRPARSLTRPPTDTDSTKTRYDRDRMKATVERLVWAVAGGLLATIATMIAMRRTPPPIEAPSAPVVVPAPPLASPATTEITPTPATIPANANTNANTNTNTNTNTIESPPTGSFDIDLAGRALAKKARTCIAPEHSEKTVAFGTGVLFGADDGVSRRLFMSKSEPLSVVERECMHQALIGVFGGGPAGKKNILEFRFRLFSDGRDEVKAPK